MHRGELRGAVRITFNLIRFLNFVFYFFFLTYLPLIFLYVNVMMEESWDVRDAYEVACLVVVVLV